MKVCKYEKDNYVEHRYVFPNGYTCYYEEKEKYYERILRLQYSLCWICKRPLCQYLLDGEMYYGQEVGPGYNGTRTYECPKFIFNDVLNGHNTEDYSLYPKKAEKREREILETIKSTHDDSMLDFEDEYEEDIKLFKNTSDEYKDILDLAGSFDL